MNKHFIRNITEEGRKQLLVKARESREKKKNLSLAYKQDWMDAPLWVFLRKKHHLRQISSYIHSSETKYIRRTLKALEKDNDWWKENFARSYYEFATMNPSVPAWALQGMMLECAFPEEVKEYCNKHKEV